MDSEEEANDVDWAIDELVAAYNAKLNLIKSGKVHSHCHGSGGYYKETPSYHTSYSRQAYEYEAAPTYTSSYEEPAYEPVLTSYDTPNARNALEALSDVSTADVLDYTDVVENLEADKSQDDDLEDNVVDRVEDEES